MKYYFENAEAVRAGIEILKEDLGITLSERADADMTVTVKETDTAMLSVTRSGDRAEIVYGGGKARFFRALAILVQWGKENHISRTVTETPLFKTNGAMVDMSRNAVMNVKSVKRMMRKMARMGMNTFMLYTEDTYEIGERPYFGYMRGRYTKEEIKELDAYARALGIELIPCIQVLGHLATMLRWSAAGAYKDTADVLLAGSDETYRLIDEMLKTVSECFTSRRLHIGMDETHDLGTGKYLDKYGYCERHEIFLSHLGRVAEMARSYGFSPMMWSDMFFRLSARGMENYRDYDPRTVMSEEIATLVPKDVQQVFWDYYNADEEFYSVNLEKHKMLGEGTVFAGGVWLWSGHAPYFSRSLRHTIPALEACRKKGVDEVFATVWHNGAESCHILSLAGLAWYADYDYTGSYDEESVKRCFRYACDADYDEFLLTEKPAYPHGGTVGAMRALLYNDPMLGLCDKHFEGLDTKAYYEETLAELKGKGDGAYRPAFDVIYALTDLLIEKADFGIRLKKAYDEGDMETLCALSAECDVIVEKNERLRRCHRDAWMEYNKPFGWEILDIRYGGISARFASARDRILDYLAGKIESLEELEAERLRFDCLDSEDGITGRFLWYKYGVVASAGVF